MAKAKTSGPRLYEGLFLLSQGAVASDFAGVVEHVRNLFTRANAELIVLRKWDERRLAYEIKGQKRGTFLLALFRADGDAITHIERDVTLSERILRVMVTRGDHLGEPEIAAAREGADLTLEVKLREDDREGSSGRSGEKRAPRPAPAATAVAEDDDNDAEDDDHDAEDDDGQ